MLIVRLGVLASLAMSSLLLGLAMARSSMDYTEFAKYGTSEWLYFVCNIGILVAICAWPWMRAFAIASDEGQRIRAISFSVLAIVLAALFYCPISSAPIDGIGYYFISCVLLIWLLYPLTRIASRFST